MEGSLEFVRLTYLTVPILSMLLGLVLVYWIRVTQWERRGATWFALMVAGGICWNLTLFGHLYATDVAWQTFFRHLEELAGLTTLALFSVFVSIYTQRAFHRRLLGRAALAIVLGGGAALVATSPWHSLLYSDVVPVTDPFPYLNTVYGIGYAPPALVVLLLNGYAVVELVRYLLETGRKTELQLLAFLLASLSIGAAAVLGIADVFPARELNHAVYGVLPSYVFLGIALFRLRLFDVQPVARNAIVENLTDPILVLDREGRIVDYNRSGARLWPSVDDRVGDPLEQLDASLAAELESLTADPESLPDRTGGDQTTDGDAGADAASSDPTRQYVRTVEGEQRHYSVTVSPVDQRYRDAVGWYAVLLRDVTVLERSRRQLQAQNERLDQVASTISHDLRNPIQVADGYTSLLGEELAELAATDAEAERGREYLAATERSLERMEAIIGDVLTIAREGKAVAETERVELGAVAREAWDHVETEAATLTVADDRTLEADRGRLLSILENLFRNSVEHGPDGVTVTVGTTAGGFYVADDGPGIPEDAAADVFEYGYTTSEEGTGLGLSIVRTMAESHGWTVDLDTDADGARFVFSVTGGEPVAERSSAPLSES